MKGRRFALCKTSVVVTMVTSCRDKWTPAPDTEEKFQSGSCGPVQTQTKTSVKSVWTRWDATGTVGHGLGVRPGLASESSR